MAEIALRALRSSSKYLLNSSLRASVIVPVRHHQWPKDSILPVIKREAAAALRNSEQYKEVEFKPVRAAMKHESSSVFCDLFMTNLERMIMRRGDKEAARNMLRWTLWEIKKTQMKKYNAAKTDEDKAAIELDPVVVVKTAFANCMPVVITKSIKRGGATYQVPHPCTPHYSEFLAMKWMLDTVKDRPKPRHDRFPPVFARELIAAYNNEGKIVKKKHDMHKLCEMNKAYAHYRWG